MSLFAWLRRLGILRFGAESGVYRDARERPLGLQMDNVFNAEKDVVNLGSHPAPEKDKKTAQAAGAKDSRG